MPKSGAFIFDMDGTLVDNVPFHMQSWLTLFRELGVPVEADEFARRMLGKTNAETLREIVGDHLTDNQIVAYAARKESLYRDLHRPHLSLVAGLDGFLRVAQCLSVPLAVATSAPRPNIDFVLGGLGIEPYFQAVVGAEQVSRGKPHPDLFLAAAGRLDMAPGRCLVFEDSLIGVEAARRAGMKAVAIATTLDTRELAGLPGVVQVVRDFTALSPAAALTLLDERGI
jgi:beta-phosphoglucomutase